MDHKLIAILLLCVGNSGCARPSPVISGPNLGNAGLRLKSAVLVWNVGLGYAKGPEGLVETITPTTFSGREVWRVAHYAQDPSSTNSNDFDLYDLDRTTLSPLRSVWKSGSSRLEMLFEKNEIQIRTGDNRPEERIRVTSLPAPEGPGGTAWLATLPLEIGYQMRYKIVDRWDGLGPARLKMLTLVVSERKSMTTALGVKDVYLVQMKPDDRSFEIREQVLASGLHFPVAVEYVRGSLKLRSQLVSLAVAAD